MANINTRIQKNEIDYYSVLQAVQQYLAEKHSQLMTAKLEDSARKEKQHAAIAEFIRKNNFAVKDFNSNIKLVEKLYKDVAEYSVLTDYIKDENDEIEEINVNAWDDIQVLYSDGRNIKIEHFCSPQHCENTLQRLVKQSNGIIDDAIPMAEGSLSTNTRIIVLKTPLVDENVGAACSIRKLKPQKFNRDFFIESGTATEEQLRLLELFVRSGVSLVVVGATGSGKTTLLNYLLSTIPDDKRIVTIEHNARELSLVKRDELGDIKNNVVHTQTKPNEENERFDISQEDLVVKALRLDPAVICVGEMRDSEAYAAQEASMTGHTVVTTIHADGVEATHFRIAMLALKRYSVDINIALMQAAMAFPVIVYMSQLEDGSRKIMDISECITNADGDISRREYHSLYEYIVKENVIKDNKIHIIGSYQKGKDISTSLLKRMLRNGATLQDLAHAKIQYKK